MVVFRTSSPSAPTKEPGIRLVTKPLRDMIDRLKRRAPDLLVRASKRWLLASAEKIVGTSTKIAQKEARGVTGKYAGGFYRTDVGEDSNGLFIFAKNREDYSNVIELGGKWKKQPPPGVLDEWINRKLGWKTKNERRQLSFAIGRAIKENRHRGRGQKFLNARYRTGRVFTMNRALKLSRQFMVNLLSKELDEAIKAI